MEDGRRNAEETSLFFLPSLRPSALLYPDLLAGCEGFNAETQRFAESRREVFFSAFLRVPLRLCVKTGLASRLRLCRAASLAPFRGWFHVNSSKSRKKKVEIRNRAQ